MRVCIVVILILRSAADAVQCVRYFSWLLIPHRRIQAKIYNPVRNIERQRGDQTVLGVEHQCGLRRLLHTAPDLCQRIHDLSVSVELVPEQICHNNHARMDPGRDLLQRSLVALDHGHLFLRASQPVRRAAELRRDSGQQIRAGFIGEHIPAALRQRRLQNVGGRRLPIRSRHHNTVHAIRHGLKHILLELHCHLARQRRAAALPCVPQNRPDTFAGGHRQDRIQS